VAVSGWVEPTGARTRLVANRRNGEPTELPASLETPASACIGTASHGRGHMTHVIPIATGPGAGWCRLGRGRKGDQAPHWARGDARDPVRPEMPWTGA
jgi:hypothetical protein